MEADLHENLPNPLHWQPCESLLARLLEQKAEISAITVLHDDVQRVGLQEGVIVLHYERGVHLRQQVDFVYRLQLLFATHLRDAHGFQDIFLGVLDAQNAVDHAEGAASEALFNLKVAQA
eukprot:scaffold7352_cov254-Pinguiococcus_pyrenoidosus.AAC.21